MYTNNRNVAHIWAHQQANSATGSNFFSDGDTIYSYGRHFPAAAIKVGKDKQRYALVTTEGYSVTTAKHMSYIRSAIDSYTTSVIEIPGHDFGVPSFPYFKRVVAVLLKSLDKEIGVYNRARTRKRPGAVDMRIDYIERYAAFAGYKVPASALRVINAWREGQQERIIAGRTAAVEREKREALELANLEHDAREWAFCRMGSVPPAARHLGLSLLRLTNAVTYDGKLPLGCNKRDLGTVVQTSRGVTMSIDTIRKAWGMAQAILQNMPISDYTAAKLRVRFIGRHVGEFTIRDITPSFIQIGCHKLPLYTLRHLAEAAGFEV